MFRCFTADETNPGLVETLFTARRNRRERERSYICVMKAPGMERGGANMTSNNSVLRYLAVRTAAFVTLTAASTGLMALPYLA